MVNTCGAFKFSFTLEKSEALIMSVLQEMPAQELNEICQYFQKHSVGMYIKGRDPIRLLIKDKTRYRRVLCD